MAILKKDDLFTKIHSVLGHLETDESVEFLEDMTDTFNDLEARANGDGEDWKAKYKENDEAWRKRYSDRFLRNPTINNASNYGNDDQDEDNSESIMISDLFSQGHTR
jgi:hypothetical protein